MVQWLQHRPMMSETWLRLKTVAYLNETSLCAEVARMGCSREWLRSNPLQKMSYWPNVPNNQQVAAEMGTVHPVDGIYHLRGWCAHGVVYTWRHCRW